MSLRWGHQMRFYIFDHKTKFVCLNSFNSLSIAIFYFSPAPGHSQPPSRMAIPSSISMYQFQSTPGPIQFAIRPAQPEMHFYEAPFLDLPNPYQITNQKTSLFNHCLFRKQNQCQIRPLDHQLQFNYLRDLQRGEVLLGVHAMAIPSSFASLEGAPVRVGAR